MEVGEGQSVFLGLFPRNVGFRLKADIRIVAEYAKISADKNESMRGG